MTDVQFKDLMVVLRRLTEATERDAAAAETIVTMWTHRDALDAANARRRQLDDRMTSEATRASLAVYDEWVASR